MKAIISLLFLVILIYCGWNGYRKGLIRGVGALLAFVVAVYAANLLAVTYSGEIIDALRPFASGYVEVNVINDRVAGEMGISASGLSVEDYLAASPEQSEEFCTKIFEGVGIYRSAAEQMADESITYAQMNSMDLRDAAVEILCMRMSFVVFFCLAFLMILILLTVVSNLINLTFKIPNFDFLNDVSGTVLGFIFGICLCLVFGWALKFTGILIPQETLDNTFLVTWFMNHSILVHFLGI